MRFDLHTHTTYSDGSLMYLMTRAAQQQGLNEIGFADHCNVSNRETMKQTKYRNGFNLDQTYKRRRKAIQKIREEYDIKIYDAVEMDYEPQDGKRIKAFLEKAEFDYSLGSIHYLDNVNVHVKSHFKNKTKKTKRKLVQKYFKKLEKMIRTEQFDIVSHIDVYKRNPALQGYADTENYEKIAEAFKDSRTIPEINAGRALRGLEELHPTKEFREILIEKGVEFTVGTDSHKPQDIQKLNKHLNQKLQELDITPVKPHNLRN
ncbi:MAG: PHP domain-containing protein [Candidatus Nanohalobium sp.]